MEDFQGGNPANGPLTVSDIPTSAFANAHTLTQWLHEQEEASRPQLAQSIFSVLLQDASKAQEASTTGKPCQKLCGFVQQCLKSKDESIRLWVFGQDVSMKLFKFFLDWYESDPHRAMKLVPEVLAIPLTRNPTPEISSSLKEQMLEMLVSIIGRRSTKFMIKAALQLFNCFLSKKAITVGDISAAYRAQESSVAMASELELWKSFVNQLLLWMQHPNICPLLGKCANLLFRELRNPKAPLAGFTIETWEKWLQEAITRNSDILEDMKNYVLMPLFQLDKDSSLALLEVLNRVELSTELDGGETIGAGLLFRLSALELGKKAGLVGEPGSPATPQGPRTKIALQGSLLASLLVHPSTSIRSCAFSLLVCSPSTTTPLSPTALDLLIKHLAPFYADYDAKFRYEVQNYANKLVRRVKNVINVAKRGLQRLTTDQGQTSKPVKIRFGPEAALKNEEEARSILELHEGFLRWYLDFLKEQLVPTASYQRHVSGLKSAIAALKTAKQEAGTTDEIIDTNVLTIISSDPTWTRLLFDLILDPFEDVRETSSALLALFPSDTTQKPRDFGPEPTSLYDDLEEFSRRAHSLATRTGRADFGDGAARSEGLLACWPGTEDARLAVLSNSLDRLDSKLAKAEQDLGHAAIEDPVHGEFASISYIWQVLVKESYSDDVLGTLHNFQRRIFESFKRVWVVVQHVLCDDSPEGHLPEELEEIEGLDTKGLLSYSFRAVHESSNLMRLLVGPLKGGPDAGTIVPPFEVFRDIGNLTFEQLSTLRHRGAFSTVALTFTTCCQLTKNLRTTFPEIPASENLLREWYNGALSCIRSQVSTTRRSAGIPALTGGILSANADSPSFREVFLELEEIAKKPARVAETDGSNLPQVHALNCLRDVFRSSLLSKRGEAYLPETLHLAANNLRSEVWAIRNCGLLLLRSLIDVLLGTGDTKANMDAGWDGYTVRISYVKYHTLPGVLLDLLKSAEQNLNQVSQSSTAEAVFPALDIIRRAGPPEEHRDELGRLTEAYLGSHIWHVREIAARTLCSFFIRGDWAAEIERLLQDSGSSTNRLHGVLLIAKFILQRKIELHQEVTPEHLTQAEASLHNHVLTSTAFKTCPEIRAAYLETMNLFAVIIPSFVLPPAHRSKMGVLGTTRSALLDIELVTDMVHETFQACDVGKLTEHLLEALQQDTNAACKLLEVIPEVWVLSKNEDFKIRTEVQSQLCSMYMMVSEQTVAPEPRTLALLNLASLLEDLTSQNALRSFANNDIVRLWHSLQAEYINPDLSYAILTVSGPIMTVLVSQAAGDLQRVAIQLRKWGAMISNALDVDETFDTRLAAATSLKSFSLGLEAEPSDSVYLPFLLALYDTLNDDDDDIRALAATAAAVILKTPKAALEAAESLLDWLRNTFKDSIEFRGHVVRRMTGQNSSFDSTQFKLVDPETELQRAMAFDDSLFATEEQNLFIDELREARRWCGVFSMLQFGEKETSFQALSKWVESGLVHLIQLAKEDDGSLGWTSDQHVFAICVRVVLSASTLAKSNSSPSTSALLRQLRTEGGKARLHGFLLSIS